MDNIYTIDPYIISVLFKTDDPDVILDIYQNLVFKLGKVVDLTIANFIKSKGLDENVLNNLKNDTQFDQLDENVIKILQDPQLFKDIKDNMDQLLKAYYDKLLPELEESKRIEMEGYILENKESLDKRSELIVQSLGNLVKILQDEGVESYEQLVQKEKINEMVDNYLKSYNN